MHAHLSRTIQSQIIPRLLLTHRSGQPLRKPPVNARTMTAQEQVAHFAGLLLSADESDAIAFVEFHLANSMTLEHIMLDLLAPAARKLGDLWDDDAIDFAQVTLGLSRLQGLLRALQSAVTAESEMFQPSRRILLLPAPGEQHTLGIVVVEEFFRGAGWDVSGGPGASGSDAGELARNSPYDVIGLSLACETRLETLALCIRRIRKASCNRHVGVLVGGPVFVARPELATLVGADATAADARAGVSAAENLLGLTVAAAVR